MPEEEPAASPEAPADKKRRKRGQNMKDWPPHVLADVDKWTMLGLGAIRIQKNVMLYHSGAVATPSVKAMHDWIKVRRNLMEEDADLRIALEHATRDVDMLRVNTKDPAAVVDATYDLICQRIEIVKKLNQRVGDAKYEKVIVDLIKALSDLMALQVKLEDHGRLMETRMAMAVKIISEHLVAGVVKVNKVVYGDKKGKEFSEAMERMVKNLNYEAIEAELQDAITGPNKQGGARG